MQTLTLTLPRPHTSQAQIIAASARFNVVSCGRRWGKTELGKNRLATPDNMPYPQAWFSPTYKMLLDVWRDVTNTFAPITARANASERRIELITGGIVEFWSLDNPDAARGRRYRQVICDEAAMVSHFMDAWQYVIRSTLVDYSGGAWFLSTPKGRNAFWQMYQWGQDSEREEWASWSMPTNANPFINDSEIEAMRETMPDRAFRQEILAEFIDDAGGVFRRVAEAATAVPQSAAQPGHQYVFGVDWAQQYDFTVIAVVDVTTNELVYMDRFNQVDYNTQRDRLKALYTAFRPAQVIAETNSIGLPNIDALRHDGMPVVGFTTTNATKGTAIDALTLAFEQGKIRILPDPVLVGELQAYEMDISPSGLRRFSAPEGLHDDTVMALAMAWQGCNAGPVVLW